MRGRGLQTAALAVALAVLFVPPGATSAAREGGIFRVSFQGEGLAAFDHVDPALASTRESWVLLDTVCARLMRYRDRKPPQGYQLVPEVAAAAPTISADGRTYTFRLRRGFRFSDGSPVRADAFAQAIHRTLAPGVDSPAWGYTQAIVGAKDVRSGSSATASGVVATDYTLRIRFTREVRDFAAWTTMPAFCAVPPTLPPSPEGVRKFPVPAPTQVRDYRPGQRVIIRRNRYYGGDRGHHVEGYDVDLSANSPQEVLDRIEAGKADWGYAMSAIHFESGRDLISKYGINHSRFWLEPGLTLKLYAFNSSRPLFKGNPELRRAVNIALNRTELVLRNVGTGDRPVPATARPGIQRPPDLPPRGRHATREGARGGQSADWQGRLLCARLAPEADRRTGPQTATGGDRARGRDSESRRVRNRVRVPR